MTTTLDYTDWRVTEFVMGSWTEPRAITHVEDLVRIDDLDRPAPGFYALPSYTG
ncbi:hypothetical protein [Nonomuraea diastatica]|uniref:hypothetical protein n=1 Tax=Nonomuraea diastatica TaxID=1848329 RepID=UPI00140D7995|nr:hypothetical protein [Nonomuraea diastatica]